MALLGNWKSWFVLHILLCYVFVMSGLITCFLMLLTYIFVWPFSKTLYRKVCNNLGYMWWSQLTFLGQWWANSRVSLYLEDPETLNTLGKNHTIVIMNHKYEVDWLMTMILAERFGILGGTKVYGKAMLKHIPILGWAWTFTESIFLKREWSKDKKSIQRDLSYICEYPEDYWVTLLLFCEGTRFTETKRDASNEVARKKGLKELKHHLLPRTKGFVLSMHGVKEHIPVISDMTLGFTNEGAEPTIMNVLNGHGVVAEVYTRRIPTAEIPLDTDENCADWLQRLYQRKDEIFDNFVSNNNHYTIGTRVEMPRRLTDLLIWIFWAVLLLVPLFKYIFTIIISGSLLARVLALVVVGLLTFVIKYMVGVTNIHKASAYGSSPTHKLQQQNGDKKSQ